MSYVDGFVLVVPKDRLDDYRAMAETAGKVWIEYGALSYRECVGDDLEVPMGLPFPKLTSCSPDEVVIFAYIEYENRQQRDEVNAKVMQDERIKDSCNSTTFDMQRMTWGGFKTIVEYSK